MSVFVAGVVVVGAGLAAGQSVMKAKADNSRLAQQQEGLRIGQMADYASTITRNLQAKEEMGAAKARGRIKLTALQRQKLSDEAGQAVARAESGTAGASALHAFQNSETQYGFQKGNIIDETTTAVVKTGKQAQEGLRITQGRMNDKQGQINMAQANMKSGGDIAIGAGFAAVKGAKSSAASVSSFV